MIQKTEALVLKREEFRETSFLLTLFTKDFGKIKSIAKGVRIVPSEWKSNFPLFSLNSILLYLRRGLSLITEAELIKDFSSDVSHWDKNISANYLVELVDLLLPLEDKNEAVFDLLLKTLELLGREKDNERLVHIFEIKILQLTGFSPSIEVCVKCKKEITRIAYFSHRFGGLLCKNCFLLDKTASSVLPGTVSTLRHILKIPVENLFSRFRINMPIKEELRSILTKFLNYHLETSVQFYNLNSKIS